jgi:two-component system response regulator LytT
MGKDYPALSLKSMKSLEQQLPEDQFIRAYMSFIINLYKVITIESSRIIFGKIYIMVSDQYSDKFQVYLDKNILQDTVN